MKRCSRCGLSKSLDEFNKNHATKDGKCSLCRKCMGEYMQVWRKNNFQKRQDYRKQYNAEHREENEKYNRRWRKEHPEKYREYKKRYAEKYPEFLKESKRIQYRNNFEKYQQYHRSYYLDNIENIRKRSQQYGVENHKRIVARVRQWRKDNPEKHRANNNHRRALKKGAEGSYTAAEWIAKVSEYGNRCAYCGQPGKMTPDHIIPLARGGSNYIANIAPACLSCNASKSDTPLEEWLKRKGYPLP